MARSTTTETQRQLKERAWQRARPHRLAGGALLALSLGLLALTVYRKGEGPWPILSMVGLALTMVSFVVQGLRCGVLPSRFNRVYAHESPGAFRALLIVYIACAIGYAGVAGWLWAL